jgi:hypothetical protein
MQVVIAAISGREEIRNAGIAGDSGHYYQKVLAIQLK